MVAVRKDRLARSWQTATVLAPPIPIMALCKELDPALNKDVKSRLVKRRWFRFLR
jgi:hypothetical protein